MKATKDSEGRNVPPAKYFVLCQDPFLSYWGKSGEKQNWLILPASSLDKASVVGKKAIERGMQSVSIQDTLPEVDYDKMYLQLKTKADYPDWYK